MERSLRGPRARRLGPLAGVLVLTGFAAAMAAPVAAHAELVSAVPGPDENVADAPDQLVARFTEPLLLDRSSLEVVDAAGATVAEGNEPGEGSREMRVSLPALGPGAYEVRWRSFSSLDQESDRGTFRFTVGGAAGSPSSSPGATPPPQAPAGGDAISLGIPILTTLAGLGGIGVWLGRRRET